MLLYLITFILCFLVDYSNNNLLKKIYIVWLYVFLCFGYTVGSDWRNYELSYGLSFYELQHKYQLSILYNILTSLFNKLGVSFWLYTGIFKCLFLYSVISTIRIFTNRVFSAIAFALPSCLLFMLIDCPFRFMIGLAFLLFAFRYLVYGRIKLSIILILFGALTHFAVGIVSVLMLVLFLIKNIVSQVSSFWLLVLLFISTVLSMSLSTFSYLAETLTVLLPILEDRATIYYAVESTDGWMTLGTIMNIFLFCVFLSARRYLLKLPYGNYMFAGAVLEKVLFPLLLIIPTGFRFNMLFSILSSIAIASICFASANLTTVKYKYRPIVLCVMLLFNIYSYCGSVYNHFVYLPYTNSIPHLLVGDSDENYEERSRRGYESYYRRIGKSYNE